MRHSPGFTLVELLVALSIIVVLTVMSISAVGPMMKATTVDGGASMVRASLMCTRNFALAQQQYSICWLAQGSILDSGAITESTGTTLASLGKSWTENMWQNGYYVTIANKQEGSERVSPIAGSISANTLDTLTAAQAWQNESAQAVLPTVGSRFLIHLGNPLAPTRQQSLGSEAFDNDNVVTQSRWDNLPERILVSPFDAVNTSVRIFPISFNGTGRAGLSSIYVTIKICDADDPTDQSQWRYVRLYKNTGRTALARTKAELDALDP